MRSSEPNILLLAPTELERASLESTNIPRMRKVAVCGFGPIASAVRTSQLIAAERPDWVVLVGIAGTLSGSLTVGQASPFDTVLIEGVGVGCGARHRSGQSLNFPQAASIGVNATDDALKLAVPFHWAGPAPRQLLTVCAASDGEDEAKLRRNRFPSADAEDMEGWSVALAGAAQGVPVSIVRGITNVAGDRQKHRWQISEALAAAALMADAWCQAIEETLIASSQ